MRRFLVLVMVCLAISLSACRQAGTANPPTPVPHQFVTATVHPTDLMPTLPPIIPTTTSTLTLTATFTATPEPVIATATITPTSTITPSPTALQTPVCLRQPTGPLRDVYYSDPQLTADLGCPTTPDNRSTPSLWPVQTRYQSMEHGHLLWLSNLGWFEGSRVVYVLLEDGTYQRYDDTYTPGVDRASGGPDAPGDMYQPQEYLGKVWRMIPGLIEGLGFGIGPEVLAETNMQLYISGEIVVVPSSGGTFAFVRGVPNRWQFVEFESLTPTPSSP